MGNKTCKVCGRELPPDEFRLTKCGTRMDTCKACTTEKRLQTLYSRKQTVWGGGKTAPFSDELLDGKEPREVIDTMVRCRKWLESRGFEITMTCIYKEVKIRKIRLE